MSVETFFEDVSEAKSILDSVESNLAFVASAPLSLFLPFHFHPFS